MAITQWKSQTLKSQANLESLLLGLRHLAREEGLAFDKAVDNSKEEFHKTWINQFDKKYGDELLAILRRGT